MHSQGGTGKIIWTESISCQNILIRRCHSKEGERRGTPTANMWERFSYYFWSVFVDSMQVTIDYIKFDCFASIFGAREFLGRSTCFMINKVKLRGVFIRFIFVHQVTFACLIQMHSNICDAIFGDFCLAWRNTLTVFIVLTWITHNWGKSLKITKNCREYLQFVENH